MAQPLIEHGWLGGMEVSLPVDGWPLARLVEVMDAPYDDAFDISASLEVE